jgi:hypothetical protein
MTWLLGDLSRGPGSDDFKNGRLNEWSRSVLGHAVCLGPKEAHMKLDFTGPPGASSGIYYSLVFQLGKWYFKVAKSDENLEVSPVHAQYYQLTIKQKEDLEARIKSGLASAAQSISDFELLKHDERKYKEFLNYFETRDEHSLRAVFIDQVDKHTEPYAMLNIVQRWPTLISDFQSVGSKIKAGAISEDDAFDPKKVQDVLHISRAEAIVLVTKEKLYREWRDLFEPEVRTRLDRIKGLLISRQKSIDEYREWLKPYVARFRTIKQAFESPSKRKKSVSDFISAGGQAVSTTSVTLWAWRDVAAPEIKRPAAEMVGWRTVKPLDPYDDYTKAEMIYHPKHGLITDYPWITMPADEPNPKEGIVTWADQAAADIKKNLMVQHRLYYTFLEIEFDRSNFRTATGAEIEDGQFDIRMTFMSQNVLLAKLMELEAKKQEMEFYIDELLGMKKHAKTYSTEEDEANFKIKKAGLAKAETKVKEAEKRAKAAKDEAEKGKLEHELISRKKTVDSLKKEVEELESRLKIRESIRVPKVYKRGLPWFKPKPYESDIIDRLAKYYIKPAAEGSYVAVVGFLKEKFGMRG